MMKTFYCSNGTPAGRWFLAGALLLLPGMADAVTSPYVTETANVPLNQATDDSINGIVPFHVSHAAVEGDVSSLTDATSPDSPTENVIVGPDSEWVGIAWDFGATVPGMVWRLDRVDIWIAGEDPLRAGFDGDISYSRSGDVGDFTVIPNSRHSFGSSQNSRHNHIRYDFPEVFIAGETQGQDRHPVIDFRYIRLNLGPDENKPRIVEVDMWVTQIPDPARPAGDLSLFQSALELVEHGGKEAIVYSEWLHAEEVPPALQGVGDSVPGDNVANLIRFALGIPPLEAIKDRDTILQLLPLDSGRISLSFPQAKYAAGLDISLEAGSDPGNLKDVPAEWEVVEAGDTVELVRLYELEAPQETDRRFARLKVRLKPGPVPVRSHRTAATLLEFARGQVGIQEWEEATLGDTIVPFYRPDIDGPAYYEFQVFVDENPAGYIMVTNGRHDHPVANWSFEGPPLSALLRDQARANEATASRLYKLDALYHVAEDEDGRKVASLGNPIVGIQGLTREMIEAEEIVSAYTGSADDPAFDRLDDADAEDFEQTLVEEGEPIPFEFRGWDNWGELKADFATAFSLQLEVQRESASWDWEIDDLAAEFGEGLHVRELYPLPALHPVRDVHIPPEIDQWVDFEFEQREGAPPILWLHVRGVPESGEEVFDLQFEYENDLTETLRFALVDTSLVEGESGELDPMSAAATVGWGGWNAFWARYGGNEHGQQRLYDQFPHSFDGEESCPVGCGPVAWAMLFGWGDKQADLGNPAWSGRWGLYRRNGSRGADAVAPRKQNDPDEGAGIVHIIKELNEHLGTTCTFGGGLTTPWAMPRAYRYLDGRTFTRIRIDYNSALIQTAKMRNRARDIITQRNNPAMIGIGLAPAHYCLAYGYKWRSRTVKQFFWTTTEYQREFFANQGFGGVQNSWIPASTWFAGEILR